MSAPMAPTIPPRPNRSRDVKPPTLAVNNTPQIPPRPTNRRLDRSISPGRENYARSPLNETPFATNLSRPASYVSMPPRPPSVTLPSIGQEGMEYAELEYEDVDPEEAMSRTTTQSLQQPEQTRNIGSDLQLHAPKPSLPKSSAKAQVQIVTRTDSGTAAALGYGKSPTPVHDDSENLSKRLSHVSRPESSTSTGRRQSLQIDDEQGIPEIGQRVPMYPNAGDVQAPSPAPFSSQFPSGIGFHSNGGQKRHHTRTRSGREVFSGPPGSYGLHGHGMESTDKFEKAWYDKHPEARLEEHGQYGPGIHGHSEYSLSSDDLNKLVHSHRSVPTTSNLGQSVTYPDEQIGFLASDEYALRMASPNPASSSGHGRPRNVSQSNVESPLRKTSFPQGVLEGPNRDRLDATKSSDHALESEVEDYIHVDDPGRHSTKVASGPYDAPSEDLGPHGGNTSEEGGWIEETGYGVPILASDEVAKAPGGEHMQPAVSPYQERRGSSAFYATDGDTPGYKSGSRTPSISGSRPTSRPASLHGVGTSLAKFASRNEDREDMHTPLEDVEEYEPLFPDEEDGKPLTAADRFKMRPGTLKRRFPSQDIWEDTPNSLQHYATVSTPDLPQTQTFETPGAEAARKGEISEAEKQKLTPREDRLAKSVFRLRDDLPIRPDMKQRFPSKDIWEDTPDSQMHVTTVSTPELEEAKSPPDVAPKPLIPPRPAKSKLGEGATEGSVLLPAQPHVPTRPPKKLHPDAQLTTSVSAEKPAEKQLSPTEGRRAPIIPDRPKPQVPARPAKPAARDSAEDLTKVTSAGSAGSSVETAKEAVSPPIPKAKPTIPARPTGSKIAALKAGFLSDLDKRLQLGPQVPKPQEKEPEREVETEKAPLSDARKGRAKGPARRKPPTSTSPDKSLSVPKITLLSPILVFQIGDDGDVSVGTNKDDKAEVEDVKRTGIEEQAPQPQDAAAKPPAMDASPLATNTAGENVNDKNESPSPSADASLEVDNPRPSASASSSGNNLLATADQTPQEEIDDPLANVPTTTAVAPEVESNSESVTTPPAPTETKPSPPSLEREPSLPALSETLSGQKVDHSRASDALETLDTGHVGESKTADEVAEMKHRGSVTVAETGSLARKDSKKEGSSKDEGKAAEE